MGSRFNPDGFHLPAMMWPWHRCCDGGYLFVQAALAAYMFSLRTLLNAQCVFWFIWEVDFTLSYFIPGGDMIDEMQTGIVTQPLDLHWDQENVPAWNVHYKVGISPASQKRSPRTCFRYQPTRPATRSSRCQPPQPVLQLGDVCPCIFLLLGTSYKIPTLPTGETVMGAFRLFDYYCYYCNLWGSRRHPEGWLDRCLRFFFRPMAAVSSGEDRILLLQEL